MPHRVGDFLLTLLTGRIAGKIIAPYLVLILMLAVGAMWLVTNLVFSSLEDRFTNQLIDSGRSVNEVIVKIETEHLQALRLMANTTGVAEAIEAKDLAAIQDLLAPLQANNEIDLVDVVDAVDRALVLVLRNAQLGGGEQLLDPDLLTWEITTKVLAGESDQLGDKWSALVQTSFGPAVYTATPVRIDERIVGTILIGSPLDRVVARVAEEALSNVSIYDHDGSVLATSLATVNEGGAASGTFSLSLSPEHASQVMAPQPSIVRRTVQPRAQAYQEMVGALELRGAAVTPLGVALPLNFIAEAAFKSRNQLMLLFSGVVVGVLAMGLMLARRITRPLTVLVQASNAVGTGDLTQEVPITTRDETGILSHSFNGMVGGLRDRERIRDTFGRYVTEQVAEAVLSGKVQLGGERRVITMLMTDIRSFTTLSESMSPENLVEMLNRYFKVMIDAVVEFGGTLDKFVGDAIVVEYSAPIEQENHEARGVLTSLRMRESLAEYNVEQEARGQPTLKIGMGVNTGPAVVGNIGSEQKLEYTAMGDTVNVSARLESTTKEMETDILISDTTYQAVKDLVEVGPSSTTQVKGREEPVKMYSVVGLKPGLVLGEHLVMAGAAPADEPVTAGTDGTDGNGSVPAKEAAAVLEQR